MSRKYSGTDGMFKWIHPECYGKMELLPFNRKFQKYRALLKSMKEYGFAPGGAIWCVRNGRMLRVKRGNHRVKVAMKLGLSIPCILSNDDIPTEVLEMTERKWSFGDYGDGHIGQGSKEYFHIKQYAERNGLPLGLAVAIHHGNRGLSQSRTKEFKVGEYEPTERGLVLADDLEHVLLAIRKTGQLRQAVSKIARAIAYCLFVPKFSTSRLASKISSHPHLLCPIANLDDGLDLIEKIYNHGSRRKDRVSLVFKARDLAEQTRKSALKRRASRK